MWVEIAMDMMNVDGFIDGVDTATVPTMTSHGDEDGDDDGDGDGEYGGDDDDDGFMDG